MRVYRVFATVFGVTAIVGYFTDKPGFQVFLIAALLSAIASRDIPVRELLRNLSLALLADNKGSDSRPKPPKKPKS